MPSHSLPLLEVALDSVDDARAASAAGAGRLELNAALSLGGLTPSLGTLIELKANVSTPVMVMIRPRPAGFVYSDSEFAVMRRDLDLMLEHGADGVVFGILTPEGQIDVERCRLLLGQCGTKETVFHRAFDLTPEPFVALEQLIELGFTRVLTSGQETTALEGAALIAELHRRAAGRIEVLPGAGINRDNVVEVLRRTGCGQVHGTFRRPRAESGMTGRSRVSFGDGSEVDIEAVLLARRASEGGPW